MRLSDIIEGDGENQNESFLLKFFENSSEACRVMFLTSLVRVMSCNVCIIIKQGLNVIHKCENLCWGFFNQNFSSFFVKTLYLSTV